MSKDIGNRIRILRVSKGLSQQDMGDKLEITPGAYAKIERGETDPSASRLFQIAGIFKVDIMVLLKDEPAKEISARKEVNSGIGRREFDSLIKQVNSLGKDVEKLKKEMAAAKKVGNKKK